MIYDSILATIGRTPVVRIQHLAPPGIVMASTAGFIWLGCWLWCRKAFSSWQP